MKNKALKEKFKNNILVRPLYTKVYRKSRPKQSISVNVDNILKLGGDGIKIKRQIVSYQNSEVTNTRNVDILPGVCEYVAKYDINNLKGTEASEPVLSDPVKRDIGMSTRAESDLQYDNVSRNSKTEKFIPKERIVVLRNVSKSSVVMFTYFASGIMRTRFTGHEDEKIFN